MTSLDSILGAILGAPSLPGARCRGRHHLFDPPAPNEPAAVVQARHNQAIGLCVNSCPALDACRTFYLESTPRRRRPTGVVAGTVINPPQPRKKRTA